MARNLGRLIDFGATRKVAWPWDDRGRSSIPAQKIAQEAEHARLMYLLAISQPDQRRTPLPTLNTH